ncbi:MAG TPA: hypothetical protein VIN01_09250 [Candidatus Dormibacteraeota bacterium]
MHRLGAALAAAFLLLPSLPAEARGNLAWEQWQHVAGVFDAVGPLPDGNLLLGTSHGLYELRRTGDRLFPARVDVPALAAGAEAYLALSPGLSSSAMGCSFPMPAVYMLKTTSPPAVLGVDLISGGSATFAPITGVDTLSGIAFDTYGRFGDRLLVIGPHAGQTVVDAIDCNGKVTVVTTSAPRMEGGMEVAPPTFGAYAGDLVVPDEYSGDILAVTAEGTTRVIAHSGLPTGGDIGVESAGFVPSGFFQGGAAYLADRATANNAHAGTDTLLRLDSAALRAEGVAEGDLLVATEGGGATVVVHCASDGSCSSVRRLGQATAAAHGEGHLLVVANQPGAPPPPMAEGKLGAASGSGNLAYLPYGAAIVVLAGLYLLYSRRRRRRSRTP